MVSYMFMLTALVTSFTACSDDDDKEAPAVTNITGTYSGYSEGKSQYFSGYMGTDETVTITSATDGTATLAYTSSTWGNSTFSGLTVVKSGDSYAISGTGSFTMGMSGGTAKEYDCTIAGTISSDKKTYTVTFTLPSVMGGLTITFQNGEAPASKIVAGTYSGWAQFAFKYVSTALVYTSEKVAVTANEDGTVNVTYTSSDLGTGTFNNVTVEKDGTNYKLTGSGSFSMGMSGSEAKSYDCNLTGTISADKETVSIVCTLPSVMGGSTITFTNGEAPAAQALVGSYSGWSEGKSNYFSGYIGTDESVKITANEDGTVNVAYTSSTWGSTTISNLTAEKDGDNYKVSGSGKYSMGMGSTTTEYDCNVSGTISSDKSTYSIAFTLPSVMGGLTITFQNGEAPVAKLVAGSYKGTVEITMSGSTQTLPSQTMKLTANEDGTVNITYDATAIMGSSLDFNNLTVTADGDNGYKISGTAKYQNTLDCVIDGTISKDKSTYTINVNVGGGFVTVVFKNA